MLLDMDIPAPLTWSANPYSFFCSRSICHIKSSSQSSFANCQIFKSWNLKSSHYSSLYPFLRYAYAPCAMRAFVFFTRFFSSFKFGIVAKRKSPDSLPHPITYEKTGLKILETRSAQFPTPFPRNLRWAKILFYWVWPALFKEGRRVQDFELFAFPVFRSRIFPPSGLEDFLCKRGLINSSSLVRISGEEHELLLSFRSILNSLIEIHLILQGSLLLHRFASSRALLYCSVSCCRTFPYQSPAWDQADFFVLIFHLLRRLWLVLHLGFEGRDSFSQVDHIGMSFFQSCQHAGQLPFESVQLATGSHGYAKHWMLPGLQESLLGVRASSSAPVDLGKIIVRSSAALIFFRHRSHLLL